MVKFLSNLSSNSTSGERSFYYRIENFFEDDSNAYAYCEPDVGGLRPDFLLLSPKFGVIVVEVKDYKENNIRTVSKSGDWEFCDQHEEIIRISNPYDQLYQYWRAIQNRINHSHFPGSVGDIPILRIAAFSNISENSKLCGKIKSIAPRKVFNCFEQTVGRNENFKNFILDALPMDFSLTKAEFNTLRANVIPTCRLPTPEQVELTAFVDHNDKVKLLDKKQEELAHDLGEGHRLIFGVAGSGKTVLLVARARHLAIRHPDWKILVLCYNRLLKNLLFHLLNPQDFEADITISTYHSWARDYILSENDGYSQLYDEAERKAQRNGDMSDFFQEFVPKLLNKKLNSKESEEVFQYDAILIDEAQDFEKNWFESIVRVLNPQTNSLLITCDGLQGIYARKRFRWSDVGIKARGRVRRFEKSYRTPIEIGTVAQQILPSNLRELIGEFDEFVPTTEFSGIHGIVELIIEDTREEELMRLTEKIHRLLKQPQKVLILFRRNMTKCNYNHPLFKFFKNFDIEWNDLESYNYESPGLMIGTLHGTKGLEFDTIVIPEIDKLTSDEDRQLLYVGMTRSKQRLIISGKRSKRSSQFINNLQSLQT